MRWERVFRLPILQKLSVNIPCRCAAWISKVEIIVVVGMAAPSHGFNVDEGWSTASHSKLSSYRRRGMPSSRI
jgi:hypothetical protein